MRLSEWIGAFVIVGLIVALLTGLGLYAQETGHLAWFGAPVLVAFYGVFTVLKLTSDEPVHDSWDSHIRFTLIIIVPVTAGPGLLAFGGFSWARPLGFLLLLLGALVACGEVRDLRRWRAAVSAGGLAAAGEVRGDPEARSRRAW